ncbi:DUF3575 domain-containing protein [Flammeovirga sp. EKP202]|uniref:DUF3575 domain-containing protein n=1 Tax=Flammeovirga sp. EKP202 TaxID=2770592 RepID=UPI00165F29CB|nr:DUF3575 domain-containing protein [Flammeovirga sp. EKP202]MBD0403937.1 DUF3575 domain-containing protein [Flammeovirga sp. EKP202]
MKATFILSFLVLLFFNTTFAQKQKKTLDIEHDSSITMMRKNIVRFNLTPYLLWGSGNYVLGYERRINDFQSVSLNVGSLTFPKIVTLPLGNGAARDFKNTGYSIAADYRRYFKKRNRGFAPDGLYWGPYIAYYRYNLSNNISFDSLGGQPVQGEPIQAKMKGSADILNIGIELGYQFIIKKRIAVDLIMIGPGYGIYTGKLKLDSDVEIPEEAEVLQEIKNGLIEKFPGLDGLLDGEEVNTNGDFRTWTGGLRFVIQVGYSF